MGCLVHGQWFTGFGGDLEENLGDPFPAHLPADLLAGLLWLPVVDRRIADRLIHEELLLWP